MPQKSTLSNKALKLEALVAAVEHLNSRKIIRSNLKSLEDNPMDLDNVDAEEDRGDEDMYLD